MKNKDVKKHLLIVDDERSVRGVLSDIFNQDNVQLYLAKCADEALEVLGSRPMDMVISDYKMPGMKGDEFLSQVQKSCPDTIRIMISAYADMDVIIRCIKGGVVHRFFPKPFIIADFRKSVYQMLELSSPKTEFPETKKETKKNILLIEDSKYFRNLLIRLLSAKYNVLGVEDGIHAINRARSFSPDLIITGLNLYGVNGLNLIKYMRLEIGLLCPVIVWEYSMDEYVKDNLQNETNILITKGEERIESLFKEVDKLLG